MTHSSKWLSWSLASEISQTTNHCLNFFGYWLCNTASSNAITSRVSLGLLHEEYRRSFVYMESPVKSFTVELTYLLNKPTLRSFYYVLWNFYETLPILIQTLFLQNMIYCSYLLKISRFIWLRSFLIGFFLIMNNWKKNTMNTVQN